MKMNTSTEIYKVKSSKRKASPVPFWRTALSHGPSTEKQARVGSAYNGGASLSERRNSQAPRKPFSKWGGLVFTSICTESMQIKIGLSLFLLFMNLNDYIISVIAVLLSQGTLMKKDFFFSAAFGFSLSICHGQQDI